MPLTHRAAGHIRVSFLPACLKGPPMRVLLTQTIERTGIVGEVLDVSDGFARNYLLPKGLAVQPTEGNIKRLEQARKDYEAKLKLVRAEKEALLAKLTGFE